MTNKSNIETEYVAKILNSPDIQRNLKTLENFNKELVPIVLELQKQAIPVLQTVHSALIAFAEKAAPYIEGFLLAQKAGVFDELKKKGLKDGDTIIVGHLEFVHYDDHDEVKSDDTI